MILPALICGMVFTSCEKVENAGSNTVVIEATGIETNFGCGCSDIATVKATISSMIPNQDGEYHWVTYVIDSSNFKDGGFKLNFPETIPDKYLFDNDFSAGITVDGIQAKTGLVSFDAYNSAGEYVGGFDLRSKDCSIAYLYTNISFTNKGTYSYGRYYDYSFEKGCNIMYSGINGSTTQKPLNEIFKWYFVELCIDYIY